MDVVAAAIEALDSGVVVQQVGSSSAGEVVAVAVDVGEHSGAAYLVCRLSDDEWRTDVVTFARSDAGWEWRSEGGSGWTALPVDVDEAREHGLGAVETNLTEDDDRQFLTIAGFVARDVDVVELVAPGVRRRARPVPGTGAYVVTATAPLEPPIDADDVDVVGYDRTGRQVDSLQAIRDGRLAERPSAMTVSEAVAQPDGTAVTVQATMLVLDDCPVRLCDKIDARAEPPQPVGPTLIVDGLSADGLETSWRRGDFGVATVIAVMHGVVSDGHLVPDT